MAPKELGDVVWYLVTSLAIYYDYSMDEVYEQIIGKEAKNLNQEDGYDIDCIYNYIKLDLEQKNIFEQMMRFKMILNKLDLVNEREKVIKVVAEIMIEIARIVKGVFGENLSTILYLNIEKLRKRYPSGFNNETANYRIDAQKKYKGEEFLKVLKSD